jgi:hypothetical protein
MARKKKSLSTKPATTEAKVVTSKTDSISYQGKVTVKVVKGSKTISTKNYSNAGLPRLFEFLGKALAGNYSENLRPCKVKLFTYNGKTPITSFN